MHFHMVRFIKLSMFWCLIGICSTALGQEESFDIENDVLFYITMKCDKSKYSHKFLSSVLLIDNQSNDTIYIENFNKYIFHKLDYSKKERTFSWDLKTLSNKEPDDIIIISGTVPSKQLSGGEERIIIAPNSIFTTDIYIVLSPYIMYAEGYYKLCLYYRKSSKCIAEMIIKTN